MTDIQYQILDELYFVIHFDELKSKMNLSEKILINELSIMIESSWVKILDKDLITEVDYDSSIFNKNFNSYYYLATKKGLFVHNSN